MDVGTRVRVDAGHRPIISSAPTAFTEVCEVVDAHDVALSRCRCSLTGIAEWFSDDDLTPTSEE